MGGEEDCLYAWHDDATVQRVYRMTYWYWLFKDDYSKKDRKLIEKSLSDQAELLMSEEFYTAKHNHGMHQDLALLVYALLLADENLKEKYISTALSRTGEYLEYAFTTDGIHKEHSPYYAKDVVADIVLFLKLTNKISPEFSEKTSGIVKKASDYLIQLIKPNGEWPSIGDSAEREVTFEAYMKDNDEYSWVLSNGKYGVRPKDEIVFPEGGICYYEIIVGG